MLHFQRTAEGIIGHWWIQSRTVVSCCSIGCHKIRKPSEITQLSQAFSRTDMSAACVNSDWDDWDDESRCAVNQSLVRDEDRHSTNKQLPMKSPFRTAENVTLDKQRKFGDKSSRLEDDDMNEMKIPAKHVGLIIGKGGSRIKELQASSGAKIEVQKSHVDNCGMVTVFLNGDVDACFTAKKLIEDLVAADSNNVSTSGRSSFVNDRKIASSGSHSNTHSQPQKVIEVYVPTKMLGLIIGKGGQKIKDIEYRSGAHIKISENHSEEETAVSIIGEDLARLQAKQTIEELIRSRETCGSGISYTTSEMNSSGGRGCEFSGSKECSSSGASSARVIDWDLALKESDRHQKEKWSAYPPIKKNFYIEDPEVSNLEPEEVSEIRLVNNNIMVQNFSDSCEIVISNPVRTFTEAFAHYPEILSELERAGFSKPSPIQMQSWPIILSGQDLIGIAQTGTGKTLAFLLPAFIHIEGQPVPRDKRMGPNVLVLSPTRELALQVSFTM